MKNLYERLLVVGFISSTFIIAVFFFILPHARFSELENRYLQATPQLTWDNILSKKFAEEAELFMTDHFPFRDKWLWAKSTTEQARLQQENNGIYKGKEGYLLEKFNEPDYQKLQQYADSVNQFAKSNPNVQMTFMLVPTSVGLYPEHLPWLAPSYPQKDVNRFVKETIQTDLAFIDGFDFLQQHINESIYYRTDHHWTTDGAYYGYVAFAKQQGWVPFSRKDFSVETVSDNFLGSYHTKSQFTDLTPDIIKTYKPLKPVKTEMYIADTEQTQASLYDPQFLNKKDQYSYFLGGVHALTKLTNKLEPNQIAQEKLLVIKDSYAHNLLPFLTNHVPEIHVIDLRYYNGRITDYLAEEGIQNVLLLFNTATFTEDANFLTKLNR